MGGLSESSVLPNNNKVSVLDVDNRHISFTHAAKARILVNEGRAEVFSVNPFTIRLKGERRVNKMKLKAMTNFTTYFKEERDVYAQNISNTQIVMQFGTQDDISFIILPESRKPYNLTQFEIFENLKKSKDLRKLCNRRPEVLRLMDEKEYMKFYEDLAKENGTTVDHEISEAYEEQIRLMSRKAQVEEGQEASRKMDEEAEQESDIPKMVKPPIVGMCAAQDNDTSNPERITAKDFISKLKNMEGSLTREDFEYLQTHVTYKTVREWVTKKVGELDIDE